MKRPHFMNHENRFFGMVGRYEVPKCRSMEIDDMVDYKMVQGLL
ncbi:unnamed protein product [marine sediment metagenome]|uniref:Uncharacterized protein n=1 Tax=marine sediment metagenome TaxID=412755 RepID=X1C4P0_9ZZZZ